VQDLTLYAIPAFVVLMLAEAALDRQRRNDLAEAERRPATRGYEPRDTAASLMMGLGNRMVLIVAHAVTIGSFFWLYDHRLVTLGAAWWVWVLLFVAEDFTYYCFHRASHEVRFLWAAHENHHSSERYNLSTALRQSWTTPFTELLFYWPLPLLGFHPTMLLTQKAISLLYQFWIHTEHVDRLGLMERLFNTPSHHRVHHGTNLEYLDRNHGGILILWDRLFGTFEPERARVRYGLTKRLASFHPLTIAFHEWAALARDVRRAPTWQARLGYAFAPPGWSPDGSTLTARQLRAAERLPSAGAA
jgi:sterol desaturase/sphingolipid hydroxylase (fatty acid hydroxylase superfamily)